MPVKRIALGRIFYLVTKSKGHGEVFVAAFTATRSSVGTMYKELYPHTSCESPQNEPKCSDGDGKGELLADG